ncbi:hypothetical protein ACP4OV_010170 [Aristida adscensionis]
MPHLDLDHLFAVFGGGESRSKVACETAAALHGPDAGGSAAADARASDADYAPAESVLLRVRDGVGLVAIFGSVLQRDGSTKGTSNPKAVAAAAAARGKGAPMARSLRRLSAGKAAVVIGGLPVAGKMAAQERRPPGGRCGWRRPAAGVRVFATSDAVEAEPVSPKVSCFGAVRSESRAPAGAPALPPEKEQQGEEGGGCFASVTAALLRGVCCSCNGNPREGESEAKGLDSKAIAPGAVLSPPPPLVGLGDAKRLASRRWPETMAGEGRRSV